MYLTKQKKKPMKKRVKGWLSIPSGRMTEVLLGRAQSSTRGHETLCCYHTHVQMVYLFSWQCVAMSRHHFPSKLPRRRFQVKLLCALDVILPRATFQQVHYSVFLVMHLISFCPRAVTCASSPDFIVFFSSVINSSGNLFFVILW